MEGLRIDFHLTTAMVAPSSPIHLDALLAWSKTQDHLSRPNCSGALRDLADALPLLVAHGRGTAGDEWCYQASALLHDGVVDNWMRMWTRKTDPYDMADRFAHEATGLGSRLIKYPLKDNPLQPYTLAIDTQRGALKNHFQFYNVRKVNKLSAWCIGDYDEIEYLLKDSMAGKITAIGAKTRLGHGQVHSIEISEDETAHEKWKLRIAPFQLDGVESLPIQAGVRPPYWAIENRRDAFAPAGIFG